MLEFDEATHTYKKDNVVLPSVTGIIRDVFQLDTSRYAPGSASFGTAVHQALELFDLGELDDVALDDRLRPFLIAWMSFLGQGGYEVKEVELRLSSALGYAGTIDRILTKNGKPVLVDLKSGAKHWTHRYQLAAYSMLYREHAKLTTFPDRIAVYLNDEGKYNTEPCADMQDYGVWNAALTIFKIKQKNT